MFPTRCHFRPRPFCRVRGRSQRKTRGVAVTLSSQGLKGEGSVREASPHPPLEPSHPQPARLKSLLAPNPSPLQGGGGWWEGLNVEAELGVQLIIIASEQGVGWGFEKGNPASPPPQRRRRGRRWSVQPPPEGSGQWGRPPCRPWGSLAPASTPSSRPVAWCTLAFPPSPRRLCCRPLLGNQVTNVKPIPKRNSASSTPHPPRRAVL